MDDILDDPIYFTMFVLHSSEIYAFQRKEPNNFQKDKVICINIVL